MAQPQTTSNGQIVHHSRNTSGPKGAMRDLIRQSLPHLMMAMPKHVSAERIARVAMTEISRVPDLARCSPASFIACLLTAAQLGLEPGGPLGHGWLIPRKQKKSKNSQERIWVCTWQTGYQGFIDLAYRSGMVTGIRANVVREGDHFEWEEGLDPKLSHRPSSDVDRPKKPILYAYAIVKIRGADPHFEVLPFVEIERRRLMNEAEKRGYFSPWREHYEAMAKKTAIRAALKYAPKSAELQRAEALETVGEVGGSVLAAVDESLASALLSEGLADERELIEPPEPEAQDAADTPAESDPGEEDTAPPPASSKGGKRKSRREEAAQQAEDEHGRVAPDDEPSDEQLGGSGA